MEFNPHALQKIEAKINWLVTQMKKKGFKSENDVLDWMVDCSDDPSKYKKKFFGEEAEKKEPESKEPEKKEPDILIIERMTND